MKHLLKNATIFVALVLTVAFTGCKNPSSNDDGNSQSKLDAPTNLVINSMENVVYPESCNVNITFNYNGKTGLDGATYGILGYSMTNDSSKAIYDTYNSTVNVGVGENTRTANISNFKAVSGKKYYFWLKVTSANNNIKDSSWSNVAEFTCPK
jgi:hypothetical protein